MVDAHVISDLHLEFYAGKKKKIVVPEVHGDICILAGDITTSSAKSISLFREYVLELKTKFKDIIYVLGNHEFYGIDYFYGLEFYRELCLDLDIHLLDVAFDSEILSIHNLRIFGSTFWVDFGDGEYAAAVERGLNDFSQIGSFSVGRAYAINSQTMERLEIALKNNSLDLVISHHKPILRKHRLFEIDSLAYGFCCTKLEEIISHNQIPIWVYGHTHDNDYHYVHSTRIFSNQVGYPGEKMVSSYDKTMLIKI